MIWFELLPLKTQEVVLDEFSVTGTENVLLLASSQDKKTILKIETSMQKSNLYENV
jgi:UDP-N-acetylglucosamine enolpyruvyl transferase